MRCWADFHPISASSLGGVKSFIGGAKQPLTTESLLFVLLHRSQPQAQSHCNRTRAGFNWMTRDTLAQPFGTDDQISGGTTGEDDQEFFSPISADHIVGTNVSSQ